MLEVGNIGRYLAQTRSGLALLYGGLLVLSALSAVHWGSYFMNQQYRVLLAGSQAVETPANAGINIDELVASRIFGIPPVDNRPAARDLPISSLNLKLTGVVASDRGGFALISVSGQPQTPFFVGEVVVSNAVLDAVLEDRVILLRNGVRESLLLENADATGAGLPTIQPVPTANQSPLNKLVEQTGDNRFKLAKKDLTANLKNPEVLRQALIVPNPGGGFVVKNIQPGSVFEKLGLNRGDVIRKVNNMDINSMVDVMQLYRLTGDIDQISNIQVEVERNGNREQLLYRLD